MSNNTLKIVFAGGGTLGPVIPLVSVMEALQDSNIEAEILWVTTKHGPENDFLKKYSVEVKKISSGKLRRYFSLKNIVDPLYIVVGFLQSLLLLRKFKPDIVASAGGYVSVPVIWAARFLGIPAVIHQQDLRPGLANRMCSWYASLVTVAFEKSMKDFPKGKTVHIGNPVRLEILQGEKGVSLKYFNFSPDLPVVLIMGGGTGSKKINDLTLEGLKKLVSYCQVIHVTGKGKTDTIAEHKNYRSYEILGKELLYAYGAADMYVGRAGLSTITELAAKKIPSVLIPIPDNQQEDNAAFFAQNNAVVYLSQNGLTAEKFESEIHSLIIDKPRLDNLSRNILKILPSDATEKLIEILLQNKRKKK